MKIQSTFLLAVSLFQSCFAAPNWPQVIDQLEKDRTQLDLQPIHLGASNTNYILKTEEGPFFIRVAPKNQVQLYADLEIENEVLENLSELNICAKPLYFDREKGVLVTDYLSHDAKALSLKDPELRAKVFERLRAIHNSNISISRTFSPQKDIQKLVLMCYEVDTEKLKNHYFTKLFPALEKIDLILGKNPQKALCHLDLHSKNLLQKDETVYLIDWEYATMSHPLLILASMASIERWNDETMFQALEQYVENPTKEDQNTLYLYRIVADQFWAVWNHIQVKLSPTDNPYHIWEELFEKEAVERIESETFNNILKEHNL